MGDFALCCFIGAKRKNKRKSASNNTKKNEIPNCERLLKQKPPPRGRKGRGG